MENSTLTERILIERLIEREGGFVDHAADRGGPTKFGITQQTLGESRQTQASKLDAMTMTRKDAEQIYYLNYWVKPGFHELELSNVLTEIIFDTAVHSGPTRAVKMLQGAVACKEDGVMGPVTRNCASRMNGERLAALYMGERVAFLGRLITKDPKQAAFAAGWMNRMREFIVQIPLA